MHLGALWGSAYQLMLPFVGNSDRERRVSAQALCFGLASLPLQIFVSVTVSVTQIKQKTILRTTLQVSKALTTITCIFAYPALIKLASSKINTINGIFMSLAIGDSISGLASMALYIRWTIDYERQYSASQNREIPPR